MLAPLFTCCLLILSSQSILGEELWGSAYLCTYLKSYKVENQHQRESQQQRDHSLYLNIILGFKIRSKDCPKWNDLCVSPTLIFKDSSHNGNTVNLEEDEDDVVMPTPRLLGEINRRMKKRKGNVLKVI
ncbi:unnamed protein product [Prunus armeniaca]